MEKSIRKQLKEEMKDLKTVVGIVSIKNLISSKVYLEGSTNAGALINRIRFTLNGGQFHNKVLQYDWNVIGEKGFLFEVIREIKNEQDNTSDYRKDVTKLKEQILDELKRSGIDMYNG